MLQINNNAVLRSQCLLHLQQQTALTVLPDGDYDWDEWWGGGRRGRGGGAGGYTGIKVHSEKRISYDTHSI